MGHRSGISKGGDRRSIPGNRGSTKSLAAAPYLGAAAFALFIGYVLSE